MVGSALVSAASGTAALPVTAIKATYAATYHVLLHRLVDEVCVTPPIVPDHGVFLRVSVQKRPTPSKPHQRHGWETISRAAGSDHPTARSRTDPSRRSWPPCRRDPERLRPGRWQVVHGRRLRVIVGGATAEGGRERLRHDVVGNLRAQPPRDIPVDPLDIPVEHAGELLRIVD
ncbi:hypothetical protein [Streptosporangium sandarakinum]|uniref:hypothetical protein n=1 Tax=Streptosporangium sandarakinum TaxID=1260955 RepID=UPI0037139BC8